MQTVNPPEYTYQDNRAGHHHGYLRQPLLELIGQAIVPPQILM